jgi:hypothetical protein
MPSSATLYRAAMLPSADLGNATAETQFSNGRATLLQLPLPSNNSLANRSFRVRISGRVVTTTNTTFNLKVYFGLSSTIASNTLILDCAAQTVNNVTSSFEVWLDCFWSADANAITGTGQGQMANNIVGQAVLTNTPLAANPNRDSNTFLASGATYGFTVTGVFGGSSAGNHAIIDAFDLEGV